MFEFVFAIGLGFGYARLTGLSHSRTELVVMTIALLFIQSMLGHGLIESAPSVSGLVMGLSLKEILEANKKKKGT